MSQRKTGKGKGKSYDDVAAQKFRNPSMPSAVEENEYPGAIKKNTYIMAKMRNSEEYHIAKIIEVRLALEGAN